MAYKLELPPSLVGGVHDIFHVSQLRKCLKAPVDVVLPDVAPLKADLTYPKHPVKILDQKDHVTQRKTTRFFKLQCSNHTEEEPLWRVKNSSVSNIQISRCHSEGVCDCSLPLLGFFLRLS
jgi:hypothetical protein